MFINSKITIRILLRLLDIQGYHTSSLFFAFSILLFLKIRIYGYRYIITPIYHSLIASNFFEILMNDLQKVSELEG